MTIFEQVEKYVRAGNYALMIEKDGTHTTIDQRNLDFFKKELSDPENTVKKHTRFQRIDRNAVLKMIRDHKIDEIVIPTANVAAHGWNKLLNADINVLNDHSNIFYRSIKENDNDIFKDNVSKEAYIARVIDKVIEECNELALALAKMKQFGPNSYNPEDENKITNLQKVQIEYNDVLASIDMLNKSSGYNLCRNDELVETKIKKVNKFFDIADGLNFKLKVN